MTDTTVKTPWHLWLVAILAVLWNSVGAFDYLATELKLEFYMSNFTPEQLDYFYAFPVWMVAAWAVAIWGSFLGSISLLFRKAAAVWLFGLALAGLAVTTTYNFVLSNGAEIMGNEAVMFTVLIWVIAVFLFLYARGLAKKGVLRR